MNNEKWQLTYYEDETAKLRKYNEKYKMWLTLSFQNEINKEVDDVFIKILGEQFVNEKIQELSSC